MRVRITFSKGDAMRYTGHLDLHRTWERTLRRSGLPLTYSQGYKPHARINLACALPLGFTSQGDMVDIQLDEELAIPEIISRLERAVPPGISIENVACIDQNAPTLQSMLEAQEYIITFQDPMSNLEQRLHELLQAEHLPRQRNGKSYDLRPLILDIRIFAIQESGETRLLVQLSAQEGATGRPEEVILALGGGPESCRVHRRRLIFTEPQQA